MNYFGLDLGSKTIGISISSSGIIAQVLTTIRFKEDDYDEAIEKLDVCLKEYNPKMIVLGLPKHMNNDLGIRGQISIDFKEKLEKKYSGINVVLWDERLSTKAALNILIKGNEKRSKQKSKKDELAAVVILQNYLDHLGGK